MTQAKFFENEEKEGYYEDEEEELRPTRRPGDAPDGGWGWIVVFGAFLCNCIIIGSFFSYTAVRDEIADDFGKKDHYTPGCGVIMEACSLIAGPFAAVLLKKYGSRTVTIAGSVLATAGLLVSTKMPNYVALRFSYGAVTGIGLGLVYLPSIMIVTKWFEHRRAFATGLAMMGAGVGYFIFKAIYESLLKTNDWANATVIVAAVSLHCAVGGALYRPPTRAKPKGMKRGVIQRGAIMKALIAEKERQRTISNGSLDNCIITKDNRLIKLDKIDLRNKSSSYINRLKETFGFSSRSLNRSKNSLVVPKVTVEPPIYKPKTSPKPRQKVIAPKAVSTPPTPKRDSGCGGSLDSPNFKSRSYEALPPDDPWDAKLVVKLPSPTKSPSEEAKVSLSDQVLSKLDAPNARRGQEKLDPLFLSNNVSPAGSGRSINMRAVSGAMQNGAKNIVIPLQGSVMTVPSSTVGMSTIYEEEELVDCKLCRKIDKWLNLSQLISPTFIFFIIVSIVTIIGFAIPYANLPVKAKTLGMDDTEAHFLISIFWVVNMISRLMLGWIADRPWASAVHLNNVLVLLAGGLSLFTNSFQDQGLLSFYAAFFGFCTAGFVTLRSIMLIELFGKELISFSFGHVTFFQGLALLVGYQFADILEGDPGFHLAGGCLVVAAFMGFLLPRAKLWEERRKNMLKIVEIEEISVTEENTTEPQHRVESCCESTI